MHQKSKTARLQFTFTLVSLCTRVHRIFGSFRIYNTDNVVDIYVISVLGNLN